MYGIVDNANGSRLLPYPRLRRSVHAMEPQDCDAKVVDQEFEESFRNEDCLYAAAD